MGEDPGEIIKSVPSKDSLGHMKFLRDNIREIQTGIPQVKGIAFFGSRKKGVEKQTSDLDTVIFYDSTELTASGKVEFFTPDNKPVSDYREKMEAYNRDKEKLEKIKQNIINRVSQLMIQRGLPVDHDRRTGLHGSILLVDISQAGTDKALEKFFRYIDGFQNADDIKPDGINGPTFELVSRFFLGVGDALYENRKYVEQEINKKNDREKYMRGLEVCHGFYG